MAEPLATTTPPPVLSRVVGQTRALEVLSGTLARPVHAYLFTGPPGAGKRRAAMAFAAALTCPNGGCGDCPSCRDALQGRHLDVIVVEREGASIAVGAAREIATLAQRTPAVSSRQVIILVDFHLVDEAAPALLKTIEEPPSSTVFVVLADGLPESLVTIASRCVPVPFVALDEVSICDLLVADGVDPQLAASAAAGSRGRLDRAALLAGDPGFSARQERWRRLPERLDGTGATIAVAASELLAASEELVAVLRQRQEEELAELVERSKSQGERALSGRPAIEARHRREQRRVRTDELRAGFATLLDAYRSRIVMPEVAASRLAQLLGFCDRIEEAARYLDRNPSELLLLESLLIDLDQES
jgi:DNA polymerase III subunit delta'